MSRSRNVIAIVTGTFALALATGAGAQTPVLQTPLRAAPGGQENGPAFALTFDAADYEALRTVNAVTLADFPLGPDEQVDLVLRRREIFSPDADLVLQTSRGPVPLARPDVVLLGGHVAGEPDSWVFLGLSPHGSHGVIERAGRTHVLSSGRAGDSRPPVIYDVAEMPEDAIRMLPFECLEEPVTPMDGGPGPGDFGGPGDGGVGDEPPPCRVARIAVETDDELFDDVFDGNPLATLSYVAIVFGASSEIFERDVHVRFEISFVRLWDGYLADPWTSGNTSSQLQQFRFFWLEYMNHVPRNIVHFLSGRPLGGGIAYLPGVCQPDVDFGLSANLNGSFPYPLEDGNDQNWDIVVVSHELGHNFGAPHTHQHSPPIDNCGNGNCFGAENGTLMSYCHQCPGGLANFNLHFHPMIIDDIVGYLDQGAPCNLVTGPGRPDINEDDVVDAVDLLELLAAWGPCTSGLCLGDINCSGTVDIGDLLDLLSNWSD
ncbi:MAG: M12 family metallo-peptidase [Planctomycetota bacterium]|jgi:hypothetical protein